MFASTAGWYDAFYDAAGKDYRAESTAVLNRVRAHNPGASSLLDVACGTGRHLQVFAEQLDCVGLDVDAGMLDVARSRCPGMPLVQADMIDFVIDERFDVVTCLFSSIGYVKSLDGLRAAVGTMASHLAPGGILVVEPSFRPETWVPGHVSALFIDQPGLQAARIGASDRRDDVAVLDLHYLVGHDGRVERFDERHELGLFTLQQYAEALAGAGLQAEIDDEGLIGRGLIVGTSLDD